MKLGALIGLIFAMLWWFVGVGAMTGSAGTILQIFGIFVFTATGIWILRRKATLPGQKPRWNYYVVAVIAEVIAIMISQKWLNSRNLGQLLLPTVGLIVGLHFTGLWYAFARRRFLILSVVMTAVNLLALLLPLTPGERLLLSGFGSSASLFVTVILP